MKTGVLLVNLGSPDSTKVSDVRKYLRQFLMDERVINAPWPIRWFIVNCLILPFRPKHSAAAYEKIWLPEGSPLVVTSLKTRVALQERMKLPVELAMRYQNPSIEKAVDSLKEQGVDEVVVVPLFPHYAMSSYESALVRVQEVVEQRASRMKLRIVPPFYDDPGFIRALVAKAEPLLKEDYDHLLFSFHGLPEDHLHQSDTTGSHCMMVEDCCLKESPAHATCYRAQCFKTVVAFNREAGVSADKYSVAFQSRLGRKPWLKPYTDFEIPRLAKEGAKKMLVICPAFVADCLETTEEIGIRGKELFQEAGGKDLQLIPCINDDQLWLEALESLVRSQLAKSH